jgi:hypothetical protein
MPKMLLAEGREYGTLDRRPIESATAPREVALGSLDMPLSAIFGIGDFPLDPDFFLGGFVMRRPLAADRVVSSSKLATCAYLHSVCRFMQARQ